MTEADPADTYEQRARAIQLANQPILDGFERWLKHPGGVSKPFKTMWTTSGSLPNIWSGIPVPSIDSMRPPTVMSTFS